ncbi:hypothetical protein DFH06DRAFT_1149945 [Mycena polygramma]|nr:hypothetical protein DFH06DRAFT_1149945 [Mycena polygramma]
MQPMRRRARCVSSLTRSTSWGLVHDPHLRHAPTGVKGSGGRRAASHAADAPPCSLTSCGLVHYPQLRHAPMGIKDSGGRCATVPVISDLSHAANAPPRLFLSWALARCVASAARAYGRHGRIEGRSRRAAALAISNLDPSWTATGAEPCSRCTTALSATAHAKAVVATNGFATDGDMFVKKVCQHRGIFCGAKELTAVNSLVLH